MRPRLLRGRGVGSCPSLLASGLAEQFFIGGVEAVISALLCPDPLILLWLPLHPQSELRLERISPLLGQSQEEVREDRPRVVCRFAAG